MEDGYHRNHIYVYVPDHLMNFTNKIEEEEHKRNPLTDCPEVVPPISVAARVVQVRSSSNEQGQSKEQHLNSIHHRGTPAAITYTCVIVISHPTL